MEFDNTNRGVLFKNDKQGVETRPDYNGKININGVEHWLASWVKTSQKGTPFMSLSIGDPVEQKAPAAPPAPDLDEDVPF
jgi:uncharacterized protein (DUF736 family)